MGRTDDLPSDVSQIEIESILAETNSILRYQSSHSGRHDSRVSQSVCLPVSVCLSDDTDGLFCCSVKPRNRPAGQTCDDTVYRVITDPPRRVLTRSPDGLRGTAELQNCSKGEQTVYLPPGKAHSSSVLLSRSRFLRSFKEISSHCSRPQTLLSIRALAIDLRQEGSRSRLLGRLVLALPSS